MHHIYIYMHACICVFYIILFYVHTKYYIVFLTFYIFQHRYATSLHHEYLCFKSNSSYNLKGLNRRLGRLLVS